VPGGRLWHEAVDSLRSGSICVVRDVAVYVALRRSSGRRAPSILHEDWDRGGVGVPLPTPASSCVKLKVSFSTNGSPHLPVGRPAFPGCRAKSSCRLLPQRGHISAHRVRLGAGVQSLVTVPISPPDHEDWPILTDEKPEGRER
jgi:hypothetical protein